MSYVELQVTSNFSFLRGGSHGEELALTAAAYGMPAIGITDINSLAGVVRLHAAAKEAGVKPLIGARLELRRGSDERKYPALSLLCYPTDRAAYGRLSTLLTLGKRRAEKGACHLILDDVFTYDEGQIFIAVPPLELNALKPDGAFAAQLKTLARRWRGRCYLAASFRYRGDDRRRLKLLAALAQQSGAYLVATNDVHYHVPARRPLQDVLTCIREHCTIHDAGFRLAANAERHLKSAAEMDRLFADYPDAIRRTSKIAACIDFDLEQLRYDYPTDPVAGDDLPQEALIRLTWVGAARRYGDEVPAKVATQLEHELKLIGELAYAPYFLTVYDIVRFARSEGILCQGRGSAANSAVCYCLGITAVDPSRLDLLFERFISAERNEPPDIDVDFEHERREEVIQYIYAKYGRHRAGIAATVIRYRSKSAIREVGKALGLSLDMVGLLASNVWGWRNDDAGEDKLEEIGLDRSDKNLMMAIELANQIRGFPRHLSQHVGGFIITDGPLSELVPIENAAMEDRTFIEWDKDDLDALGILKIDVLGLGMLTCIRKCFDLIEAHHGKRFTLATVPAEEEAVYDMLCLGDSVGVFQVESRAQMTMLPRLRPRDFYDLVIEVAIVRPGPIQGDMVHPYLRRRAGEEPVEFPSEALERVLGKTLGVPLFQEQAMQIAIVAAGFTPSEADKLRRAMATFRRTGTIQNFHQKMIDGMTERGYEEDFAERCFRQIEGFGEYGFPESHAASFALLVYVSAWLKRFYPAAFACGLLNSQPMGFYAPAQIVRDAREHGVTVLPPDVNASAWDSGLENVSSQLSRPIPPTVIPTTSPVTPAASHVTPVQAGGHGATGGNPSTSTNPTMDSRLRRNDAKVGPGEIALRLGFRQIKGFKEAEAEKLLSARQGGYETLQALWQRAGLEGKSLERLANADAWRSVGLDRRQALWALKGLKEAPLPLFAAAGVEGAANFQNEPVAKLPALRLGEHVVEDYVSLRLSLKEHPLTLLRRRLGRMGAVLNEELKILPDRARVTVAGLVLARQRPGTAKGVIFATLEDETGVANVVVWPDTFETYRRSVVSARLMLVKGELQREGIVIHVIAKEVIDLSSDLDQLAALDHPADATALLGATPNHSAARSNRHPRNVALIHGTPSVNRIKPKSRDFH